jgi:hypothetical protein
LGVAYVLRSPLRASAMVLASLVMGLSTLVCTLAGHSNVAIVLVAAAWSFWCRLLWALGVNVSWIGQQCVLKMRWSPVVFVAPHVTQPSVLD